MVCRGPWFSLICFQPYSRGYIYAEHIHPEVPPPAPNACAGTRARTHTHTHTHTHAQTHTHSLLLTRPRVLRFVPSPQRIVGEGVEITALTWACDSLDGSWRTFCAALDGSLAEVQWKAGKLEASTDSGAGAIWSLAAQPAAAVSPGAKAHKYIHGQRVVPCPMAIIGAKLALLVRAQNVACLCWSRGFAHSLAASCDDGSVRIFHVEGGETGAHYSRTLARLQECSLLTKSQATTDGQPGQLV
eukprot:1124338-Pelagomonas_calceolata.AAC.3